MNFKCSHVFSKQRIYRNATIFCVSFTFANFVSPYSLANIRSQTLNNNLWA